MAMYGDDDDVTTLDATYLVAKEAKTALEQTRKARAKALPTDMQNWDSGLKLKGMSCRLHCASVRLSQPTNHT